MSGQVVKVQGGILQIVQGWRPVSEVHGDDVWTIESIATNRDTLFASSDPGVPPFMLESLFAGEG